MSQITEFVDEFPSTALQTALSFIKGGPVTKKDIGLAVLNIESYAMHLFIDDKPIPMGDGGIDSRPTSEEAEAAIMAVMANQAPVAAGEGDRRGKWTTLLRKLLPVILDLL